MVLRSKSPDMVRQEVYALLCVYHAIRHLIATAAEPTGMDPDRISFTRPLQAVRRLVSDEAALPPCALADLVDDVIHEITDPRHLLPAACVPASASNAGPDADSPDNATE
ncbi:hypothetical protein [Nonomuraea antri]|uniref:hypothetical protein n=1 Tax=Nonomuraea antri TaxID=2730852 RepID=UPI001F3C1B0F|nr:hypothetical protein [Nonomuraea antri]